MDDAHGFGVIGERSDDELSPYGSRGNSVVRHYGESYDGIVLVSGFSKSYSSLAAFIACPKQLKELLKTAAPPYLYSGPSPTASLATVLAGFEVNEARGEQIRSDLWRKTAQVLECLDQLGIHTPNRSGFPIVEVPLARHEDIDAAGRFLFENGIYVTLAAYPLVPKSEVGFRIQVTAANSQAEIEQLVEVIGKLANAFDLRPAPAERVRGMSRLGNGWTCESTSGSLTWSVGAVLTGAYLWFPPLKGNGPLINLLGLSSSIAIAVGIYLHRPRARAAWFLFIVGQFLFFAGDLYTYSYPKVFGADVEFPSLGDAIYLTVYPALVGGLLILVKRRNPRGDRAAVIDSLILTVGIGLISWVFLVAPNIHLSASRCSRRRCRPPIRSATSCCSRRRFVSRWTRGRRMASKNCLFMSTQVSANCGG